MWPTYEELLSENQALKQEVQILRQQNQALMLRLEEALSEIHNLKKEILELKDKLNTNSKNSSTPPTLDPFRPPKKKPSTGRKQGGQPGHTGHRRSLYSLDQVQIVLDLKPNECPNCESKAFTEKAVSTEVRQVVELPDAPPNITQYNIHTCQCSCCGKHVKASIPLEAQYGFGPRLMGFVTSLTGEFRLSKRQVAVLVGKIGIRICSGSVCKIHARASEILKEPYEEIRNYTLQQEHLNGDESSWKTLAEKRWLWIGHGKDSVFFKIKASRSAQAFREVFGTYKGGLTTDRYSGYNTHEGPQQLCWSHTDRDFEKISTRDGFDKLIGESLLDCKKVIFDCWHQFKNGHIDRAELIRAIEAGPKEDLKVLLKAGAVHEECMNKTKATCIDYLIRFDALWLFVYTEGIEPTNNVAERGLRHGVIWRKLSHGSQSETGERFVERVMTIAMTLKLRAQNTFEYFTECFRAFIQGGQSPPIFQNNVSSTPY
jgi:transposase